MVIRHADPDDAAGCLAIYSPFVETSAVSFEDSTPPVEQFRQRILRSSRSHAFLVAQDAGLIAGFAYAGPHRERTAYRWAAEVSVYLGERHRGQGLGRALYENLFSLLEQQGYRTLLAAIALPNPASVALHRALGFTEVGVFKEIGWKLGAWHDVLWLARRLGPGEQPVGVRPRSPGPPVRLAAPVAL